MCCNVHFADASYCASVPIQINHLCVYPAHLSPIPAKPSRLSSTGSVRVRCSAHSHAFPASYVSRVAHTRSIFDADNGFNSRAAIRSSLWPACVLLWTNKRCRHPLSRVDFNAHISTSSSCEILSRRRRRWSSSEMRGPISSDPAAPCFHRCGGRNIKFPSRSRQFLIGNRGLGAHGRFDRRVWTAFANEWWRSTTTVLIDQTCRHDPNEVWSAWRLIRRSADL